MVQDPVCGMEIKDTPKAISLIHKGKTFFFCTDLCKIQFEQNPEKYIKKSDDKNITRHSQ
jgi:YHS domain-containing protein